MRFGPAVNALRRQDRADKSVQYFAVCSPFACFRLRLWLALLNGIAVSSSTFGVWRQVSHFFERMASAGMTGVAAGRCQSLRFAGLLAVAVLLLPGCGAVKIAYNQAPDLAYWYFDGYADFNSGQSLQIKADLARLQAWHRQTQLPGYAQLLQDAQRQVRGDISPAQACVIFADARRKLLTVVERAEPSAALLAASLDASQLQHLERRYAKGNAEYREDFLDGTPEAVRKRRLKKMISRAEMLYGRLDNPQTVLLGRMLDQSRFDAARTYAERLRRQRDALDTLRQLVPVSAVEKGIKAAQAVNGLIERAANSPDAAYRDYAEKLTADNCKLFSEFHNTTSAAQRGKAAATLSDYEKDARALAEQGAN